MDFTRLSWNQDGGTRARDGATFMRWHTCSLLRHGPWVCFIFEPIIATKGMWGLVMLSFWQRAWQWRIIVQRCHKENIAEIQQVKHKEGQKKEAEKVEWKMIKTTANRQNLQNQIPKFMIFRGSDGCSSAVAKSSFFLVRNPALTWTEVHKFGTLDSNLPWPLAKGWWRSVNNWAIATSLLLVKRRMLQMKVKMCQLELAHVQEEEDPRFLAMGDSMRSQWQWSSWVCSISCWPSFCSIGANFSAKRLEVTTVPIGSLVAVHKAYPGAHCSSVFVLFVYKTIILLEMTV